MRVSQYTAPTTEPIHLTEAKLHLRLAVDAAGAVAYTAEDVLLSSWITAARQVAETETWKALVIQVWDFYLDEWPAGDEVELPLPPLRKVEFIKYTESDGTVNTLATTEYEVDTDSQIGRVLLAYGKSWPSSDLAPKNPIQIRFRCGALAPFTANASTDVLTAKNHPYVDGNKVRLSVSGGSLPTGLVVMTDYFVRDVSGDTLKLAATDGGAAIDITSAGSGNMFLGDLAETTKAGMKLVIDDLYNNRGDTIVNRYGNKPMLIPRAATHLFAMDSVRCFK